jgi:hypothetical protein
MSTKQATRQPRDVPHWLRICSRAGNIVLGVTSTFTGLHLVVWGTADLCSFDDMPRALTGVVGAGFVVGGVLLSFSRTALAGITFVALWALVWTWTIPTLRLWGNGPCVPSAFGLTSLCLNMALMGLSGPVAPRKEMVGWIRIS